jgi:hypothetical protein
MYNLAPCGQQADDQDTEYDRVMFTMYNLHGKKEFIDSCCNDSDLSAYYILLFNNIEMIEKQLGKDVSEFTDTQIDSVATLLFASNDNAIASAREKLINYKLWKSTRDERSVTTVQAANSDVTSVRTVKSTANTQSSTTADMQFLADDLLSGNKRILDETLKSVEKKQKILKIRSQFVTSPYHLQVVLNRIYKSDEFPTIDCIYRTYFWLAFAGILEEDAVFVTANDVNLETLTINGKFPIYSEGVAAIKNACEQKWFDVRRYNWPNPQITPRYDGSDNILRGVQSDNKSELTVRSIICRKIAAINKRGENINITYNRVKMSGGFYRAYEREKAGLKYDFNDLVEDRIKTFNDYSTSIASRRNHLRGAFMRDYLDWKDAFNL